jgi:hypothetical protein
MLGTFEEEFSELANNNPAYMEKINTEGSTNPFVQWDNTFPELMSQAREGLQPKPLEGPIDDHNDLEELD